MAADGGTVEIEYKAKIDRLQRDMDGLRAKVSRSADDAGSDFSDRFTKHMHGLGSRMSSLGATIGKGLALGIAGATAGLGLFAKSAIEAGQAGLKVDAQTRAVIESTGGAANVSAASVRNYADSLGRLTGIDDDAIASGQNMLLTFTNVRNEVGAGNDIFNQATRTVLDMSTALGQDTKTSAIQLGKALNDPIRGVSALQRVGVTFTDSQKDMIESLVASGDVLGAQKIILKELGTEFGGSAEAAATPLARLKVVAGQLQGEIGERLLPVVNRAATFLADKLPGALDKVGTAFGPVMEVVGFAKAAFTSAFSGEGVTSDGYVGVFERIGVAARAIVGWVRENWPQIKVIITETMATIGQVVSGVVDTIMTIWRNFGPQITAVVAAAWDFVKSTIQSALDVIQGIVKVVTGIIHGDWSRVWEGIKQILGGVWDFIVARIELGIAMAKEIISVGWEIVKSMFSAAWDKIKELLASAWESIKSAVSEGIGTVVGFVTELPGKIIGALGDVGRMLWDAGWKIMLGLKDGIVAGLEKVKDFVGGIAGKIISWKGPLSYDKTILVPAGRAIMDSLVTGLRDREAQLVRQLAHVTGLIESVGADPLGMAAGSYGASLNVSGMGHTSEAGEGAGLSSGARPINVGPFYVKENDLPTEIPRRLRGALHLWDR